ncbi:amyloid-beta-like protein isoform X1 [Plodia interpunctella]|uniref:amyloid-beta-like protein isoform X1 n=1 Tax=Plodia interpunctella TaxID=58824 RepID=UPI002367ED78|nr:amyloid-beta-like protein isoform X1 [Plodia interpunctella]
MSRAVLFISVFTIFLDVLHAGQASTGAEPQVAVLCEAGSTYHPQYMSSAGRWTPDLTTKPHNCLKDKMEILDYCKKVYPSHDITNIVEASHYVKVSNWCKLGSGNAAKCKTTRWVKPFRCLEGPFQSDALLVPESCLFDHIHNQSRCWQFARWNATAGRACAQRGLRLRTFAMLLPCGISLFSGVEFVCCPKHFKENVKLHKPMDVGVPVSPGGEEMLAASAAMDERDDDLLDDDDALDDDDDDDTLNLSDDDDDDDTDDDMDEDEDADFSRDDDAEDDDYTDGDDSAWPRPDSSPAPSTTTTSTTTSTTTTASTATSDPYFSHFDPRTEHQSYKDAQQRLEETHREKITKVMKEWSELEDRYQQMMASEPAAAQTFRQRMTAKFQANVQSLEEEGVAERRRLAALHQQRVLAHLAQRRRTALACYTRSLRDTPPNAHRVQKCLQRLVRALAAERSGAIAAWRRAAAAGREAAAAERASAADRLQDADRALQRALTALRRRQHLYANIGTAIEDYVQSMQSKDDMAVSLMSMTPEAEELLLDRIEAEVQREQAAREQMSAKRDQRTRQRQDIQNERAKTSNGVKESDETDDEASEVSEGDETTSAPTTQGAPSSVAASPSPHLTDASVPVNDVTTRATFVQDTTTTEVITSTVTEAPESETPEIGDIGETSSRRSTSETEGEGLRAALEHAEERAPPPPAHALKHELQHSQPGYTVRGAGPSSGAGGGAGALYPALMVGGAGLAAAACVALAVARRRSAAPAAQGFVQVEQAGAVAPTPEERHVANMQINGYENPTYKYFEVKE